MNKKSTGIILMVGAILYFIFTSFIVGHGIHPLNTLIAIFLLVFGAITMFKREPEIAAAPLLPTAEKTADDSQLPMTQKLKIFFVSLAFGLLTAIIVALTYLATSAGETLTTILSFAGGVSNIVLPCTLPLVFIIVPMAMIARNARKGLVMAALFGVGLIITLSAYGAVTALAGKYLGLDKATMAMYAVAGLAALAFGLTELKLLKLELPSYMGTPEFLQGTKGDYSKAFLL